MSKKIKKTENLSGDINEVSEAVDDIVFESEEEQGSQINVDSLKKLREKLKKAVGEKQEYLEGWQRAKADLINAKKEFGEEKIKLFKFANENLIIQVIPVLDSFEMAFANKKTDGENFQEWLLGMEHIYNQLLSILKESGVEQINPLNEKFDPVFHASVGSVKIDDKKKEGIIKEVIQKGYLLNGKVVREAKVKVGELKKQ